MRSQKTPLRRRLSALLMASVLVTGPALADAAPDRAEHPGFFTMTADLVLVRPLMLGTTLAGSAIFLVSSPFSAIGGNLGQAAQTLVKTPFDATFRRCLGCGLLSESYRPDDVDEH